MNAIILAGGTTAIETPLSAEEVVDWFIGPGPKVWCCHVALIGDELVGFQSVGRFDKLPVGWGEMGTYTKRGHAKTGIGSALFAATRVAARALGLTHLNALIRCDNTGGLAYYSRMGFGDDQAAAEAALKSGKQVPRISKRLAI